MQYDTKADGILEFTKEVSVQEGRQYQYKFRLGEGEWWVLNEEAPTGMFRSVLQSSTHPDGKRPVNLLMAYDVGMCCTILILHRI
jgi:hypothetical protein